MDAEHHASDRARRDEGLRWSQWADRINRDGMATIGGMVLKLTQRLAEGEPVPKA